MTEIDKYPDQPWRKLRASEIQLSAADVSGWLTELTSITAILGQAVGKLLVDDKVASYTALKQAASKLEDISQGIEVLAKKTYERRSEGGAIHG